MSLVTHGSLLGKHRFFRYSVINTEIDALHDKDHQCPCHAAHKESPDSSADLHQVVVGSAQRLDRCALLASLTYSRFYCLIFSCGEKCTELVFGGDNERSRVLPTALLTIVPCTVCLKQGLLDVWA